MPPIRAILFDLDDTLADEVPSADRALLATGVVARDRYGVDPAELLLAVRKRARQIWYAHPLHPFAKRIGVASWEALWARFEGDGPELAEYREWMPDYRFAAWHVALRDLGVENEQLARELAEMFPGERRRQHRVYPDAVEVLGYLRERGEHRLGVVTNGLSCLQREKFEEAGLVPYFDTFVAGGDVGVGKPDPTIFFAALRNLDARPDEAIMIGNSLEKDVAGARAAGIFATWLCRDGAEGDADARIGTLTELPALLEKVSGTSSEDAGIFPRKGS